MRRLVFVCAVIFAVVLTVGGAEALVRQVDAADGLKSSIIAFVLNLGFALLGPAVLYALVFFRPEKWAGLRSDSRGAKPEARGPSHRTALPQRLVPHPTATGRQ